MAETNLKKYIEQQLKQGYNKATIRQALTRAGYSPSDINKALRQTEPRKASTKLLLIIFLVILIAALAVILILKVIQKPQPEIRQTTELFSTRTAPGQEFLITVLLEDTSGRKISGLIDYAIQGPEGTLLQETDEFTMKNSLSKPKKFNIPEDALQGAYRIRTTVSYNNKKTTKSKDFEIVTETEEQKPIELEEQEKIQKAIEEQETCPTDCDDYDFCTEDFCVKGKCVHKPIVPCCGNNICEKGETARNCALDCAERPPSPKEVKEKAAEQSKTNIAKAISTCEGLNQQTYVDSCLLDVSEASKDKTVCERIAGSEMRDACYIPFAYENDFSVCEKLTNPTTRNTCYVLKEINQIKQEIPEEQPAG